MMRNGSSLQVLLLSPHRDDAAFSCGLLLRHLLRNHVGVTVLNVCTVSDYAPYREDLVEDRLERVTELRAQEDATFGARLPAPVQWVDLAWQDAPLRLGTSTHQVLAGEPLEAAEVARLEEQMRGFAHCDAVIAPMALGGHVDHRLVHEAAKRAYAEESLLFYEDLPYAGWLTVAERKNAHCMELWGAQQDGAPGEKFADAQCYPSQIAESVAVQMEAYVSKHGWRERLGVSGAERMAEALGLMQVGVTA